MKRPQWAVRLLGDERGRYVGSRTQWSGPGIDALIGDVIEKIADLASYEDSLTEAWFNFVNARRAVVKAEWDLVDDDTRQRLEEIATDAKAAVLAELPSSVTMSIADTRIVSDLMFEAAGRVGMVDAA